MPVIIFYLAWLVLFIVQRSVILGHSEGLSIGHGWYIEHGYW